MYEKVKYKEESLEPHLWTYRSRITLEHLRQTLQEEKMRQDYPILSEFLQAVCYSITYYILSAPTLYMYSHTHTHTHTHTYIFTHTYTHTSKETELRATQYLPDIARLQQYLYDKFNQQIDRKDIKKLTIQTFIKELPNGNNMQLQ